jgi:hypothetical protein
MSPGEPLLSRIKLLLDMRERNRFFAFSACFGFGSQCSLRPVIILQLTIRLSREFLEISLRDQDVLLPSDF